MSSPEPVRQPANDLVAFDISRQSPEHIAQLFARWKEQRKRLNAPQRRAVAGRRIGAADRARRGTGSAEAA